MSVKDLWNMVNNIPHCDGELTREQCIEAEKLLMSEDISNDDFDDLMMAISFIFRTADE